MKDENKTKEQLINELVEMRQRVAKLEAADTERKRAEEALRIRNWAMRSSISAIVLADLQGNLIYVNPAFLWMWGYEEEDEEEVLEKSIASFWQMEEKAWDVVRSLRDGGGWMGELVAKRKGGSLFYVQLLASVVTDEAGKPICMVVSFIDITERKQAEETIKQMAYHDALTGLPTRRLFNDRLTLALAHAQRNQQKLAVMLLDLDNFKEVNDTLGHDVGDQLLQVVSERLTSLLRKGDTAARMGGDEFMLLLPEITQVEDAAEVAAKILEALREPYVFDDHELHISTSIGVALYPDAGEDGDTLMKNADIAMYRAKDQGRDNYQRYTPAMNAKALT